MDGFSLEQQLTNETSIGMKITIEWIEFQSKDSSFSLYFILYN